MRFAALVLVAALPLALGACGSGETSTEPNTSAANESTGSNASAAAIAPSGAQDFVNKVAASDRFEIEASKLVASSAASSEVMAFARQMLAAHTDSTAKLKAAVAKDASITFNDQLNPSQQATLEDMKMKKGYIFDAAYLAAQVHGHDQALTELKNYTASGDNAALKDFAQGVIPTVTEHLEKAKSLSK